MLNVSSIQLSGDNNINATVSTASSASNSNVKYPTKIEKINRIPPQIHDNNDKHETETKPKNDYIKFKDFMAPQIGGISKGLFEKFENRHEHNLVQLYCDSLNDECIGYAYNKNGGYQFYSKSAWPMKEKKGWDFYMKHDPNNILNLDRTGLTVEDIDFNEMTQEMADKYSTNNNGNIEKEIKEEKITVTTESKIKKRYISYAQNVGRVNNQLVSFEAMIQYSLYYNRTLVIPWPRHQNHVMGLELGFWDYDRLREIIDIVIEHELPENLKNYRDENGVPTECRFIKLVGRGIPTESNEKCEMIYLYEGDLGIFHFRDGPQNVMKYIIPAPYIRNAVESFLKSEFGQLSYRVGVHRRAMDEGGRDPKTGTKYVCRWESRGIHGDSRFSWLRNTIKKVTGDDTSKYDKIIAMYHHSCAMDWYDLQNILIFHKQKAIENNEKFFIAHDHQEQWVIDDMKKYGGIEQPSAKRNEKYSSKYWSNSSAAHKVHRKRCKDYGHCANEATLQMKEEILFDMWALYYSQFLAGTWMSTLTRTICHWKGFEESMYNGNQCWLKWKWERTVNHENDDWYTLQGLNETALFD